MNLADSHPNQLLATLARPFARPSSSHNQTLRKITESEPRTFMCYSTVNVHPSEQGLFVRRGLVTDEVEMGSV